MPPNPILKRVSSQIEGQEIVHKDAHAINADGCFMKREIQIQSIIETFDIGISFHADIYQEKN